MLIMMKKTTQKKRCRLIFSSILLTAFSILSLPVFVRAQEREVIETQLGVEQILRQQPEMETKKLTDITFEEQQIKQINESLKNVIDENKKLVEKNNAIEAELKALRGQEEIRANRVRTLTRQRDDLDQQIESKTKEREEYEKQLQAMKSMMEVQEKEYEKKIQQLEAQVEMEEDWQKEIEAATPARGVPHAYAMDTGTRPSSRKLERENEVLRNDAARVHYNLGNIHFRQGHYEKAAEEYQRAVDLVPYDAEAHYNLAFVLGEYLHDPRNALKHYQQYLYLRPDAQDALLVKEKMTQARLKLRTLVDSHLDKDDPDKKVKAKDKPKPEIVLE